MFSSEMSISWEVLGCYSTGSTIPTHRVFSSLYRIVNKWGGFRMLQVVSYPLTGLRNVNKWGSFGVLQAVPYPLTGHSQPHLSSELSMIGVVLECYRQYHAHS